MTWTFTEDLDAFLATAGDAAATHPAENTLILTITAGLKKRGLHIYGDDAPVFGWWRGRDGAVEGTAVWTPPHPFQVGVVPEEALAPLAAEIRKLGATTVNARPSELDALTADWPERRTLLEQRLYRLDELTPPSPAPPGRARIATESDRELLVEWLHAFARDTGTDRADAHVEEAVTDRLSYGGLTLWEHEGTPVSLAGAIRPVAGSVRVAPVYTPPELRGHGYAAAVTAEVSRAAQDAGAAEVLLFTDLANPTSNGVYQRIGYRPVTDRVIVTAS
ncbi:GNAT family N-acetyltransferase [Streptomyces sp. NBC_01465]|uniref:GNAT family N-acetyltransferase n=1 Tax=Streptomyces sp. NBC_01465 TaxID=2903878 RepID=UPI002E2FC037|nr:GNAT family N-acetyltransferase [Streptomyces sp. NBC_01465]